MYYCYLINSICITHKVMITNFDPDFLIMSCFKLIYVVMCFMLQMIILVITIINYCV